MLGYSGLPSCFLMNNVDWGLQPSLPGLQHEGKRTGMFGTTLEVREGTSPVVRGLKIGKCSWEMVCRGAVGWPAAVWVGAAAFCCQLSLIVGKLLFQQLQPGVSFGLGNKCRFFNQPKIWHCNTQILQIPKPWKEIYFIIAVLLLLLAAYFNSTFCFIHLKKLISISLLLPFCWITKVPKHNRKKLRTLLRKPAVGITGILQLESVWQLNNPLRLLVVVF